MMIFNDETCLYQCSVTGLVFLMKAEGDVVHRTVPWNRRLLAQHHKNPAGPLFDIKCQQQSVCQLHLPHCEIISTGGGQFLQVAHVNDEGIEFINPQLRMKTLLLTQSKLWFCSSTNSQLILISDLSSVCCCFQGTS